MSSTWDLAQKHNVDTPGFTHGAEAIGDTLRLTARDSNGGAVTYFEILPVDASESAVQEASKRIAESTRSHREHLGS